MLFIPGTVAKGFQEYRAEIFYRPACLQPVIMRSRCLMCANALADCARENPSRERGRGKSGENYVLQSQTLFRSYCKRPRPPLREARKNFESESYGLHGQTVYFSPVLFEVSIGRLLCQVQGRAGEKAAAEERSRAARAGPRRPGLRTAWPPRGLGLVARSPRGRGQPRPWAALSTPPFLGCSGLLGLLPNPSSGRFCTLADPTARLLQVETRPPG